MNPGQQERLEALRPYIVELERWAKRSTAPVFWRETSGDLRNGSMAFVSTGTAVLGVTAGHVADDCILGYAPSANRTCQVGGAPFDPVGTLIERHPTLDLATFRLSEEFVATAGGEVASTREWPPALPEAGDVVLFGGFPGAYREERSAKVDFAFAWFAARIESSSGRKLGVVLRIETSLAVGPERVPAHADLGGWSGGPVFRLVEKPLVYLGLAAVIYEYSPKSEIVFAYPLVHVNANGAMAQL